VARILLLGPAGEAAARRSDVIDADTLADVLREAEARYGDHFSAVLARSQVWVNGVKADPQQRVGDHDEVAVLPPVSGGC
jgi:molybdopterin converting factor small subunit